EDNCLTLTQAQPEGSVNPRGPWLRSNIYGKRVNDKRDKRFHSNPMQSISGGQFNPIPKAMLEMLAKMKLEEDNEEEASDTTKDTPEPTTLNPHKDSHTPIIAKRKFHKIQGPTQHQMILEATSTTTMACLEDKACQGQ
ncbi:hypothetical protein A2U01_0003071, partial [Trifolium medium]|nr:hypothetical protein [Trifolium medium]